MPEAVQRLLECDEPWTRICPERALRVECELGRRLRQLVAGC